MPRQDSKTKILDQILQVLRLQHYSIHTERANLDWIKRYIAFHRIKSRDDLAEGEQKIEAFLLTWPSINAWLPQRKTRP